MPVPEMSDRHGLLVQPVFSCLIAYFSSIRERVYVFSGSLIVVHRRKRSTWHQFMSTFLSESIVFKRPKLLASDIAKCKV